jgi:hypothetical protein
MASSAGFFAVLAGLFLVLAVYICLDPVGALEPHGLDLRGQPPSALAEVNVIVMKI